MIDEGTIPLRDGRLLGYAQYGDPSGKPVFHFHGSGGSRMEHPVDESILTDLGIRFISTDRPGHGLSDLQPDRKLLDWPDDIAQLADHLGIDTFYVLGWSAGGPYALACAYKLKDRIIAGAIVSGFAPPDRPDSSKGYSLFPRIFMFSARHLHPLIKLFRKMGYSQISSGKDIKIDSLIPHDKKIMEKPENYQLYMADIREGYRQGWQGIALDDIIINNPWGFSLEDIQVHIDIWQGECDQNVPLNQGKYQHEKIPDNRFTVVQDQAHLYLLSHWREVLATLTK
ncbi:MAG: alpha/beta hydrolase [Desulfobacterales bacterium]|nr:alpha/beta hydrolase [Desulfobacterales bacterium]